MIDTETKEKHLMGAEGVQLVYKLRNWQYTFSKEIKQEQDIILGEDDSIDFEDNPVTWITDYKWGVRNKISLTIALEYPFTVTTRQSNIDSRAKVYTVSRTKKEG